MFARVTSIDQAYLDPASNQVTVEGSYAPTLEMLKAMLTGLSCFKACACGAMLLFLLQSGFDPPAPDIGMFLQDLWPGHAVWEQLVPGQETQTSTPAFIKRLAKDTEEAFLMSAVFAGTTRRHEQNPYVDVLV